MSSTRRRLLEQAGQPVAAAGLMACAVHAAPFQVAPRTERPPLAALWSPPSADRDLFFGVGGPTLQPDLRSLFTVMQIKATGFSDGYVVVDEQQREWSVKLPPEGATEVVASRILWGIGYHQPPIYLLDRWRASGATEPNPQRPARFREKRPPFHALSDKGVWSYYSNPFAGSRPMNGLLVLQAMLGNSDLKDENNAIYELDQPLEGASQWFVARDLGQTFGRTGRLDPPRGDIDVFEQTPFIHGVAGGDVQLEYTGRHRNLFERLTVDDVHWICTRLAGLTDEQWADAFRAGGYQSPIASRFIRRLKTKIAEGLALRPSKGRSS